MLVGVHENRDPSETKGQYPRISLVRRFIPGVLAPQSLITKFKTLCEPIWAINGIPIISFKPELKSVANGRWRAHLTELALWIKTTGKPCFIAIWHEPENDMTASQFVSMFNTCYNIIKKANPQITVIHSAMAYQYRPSGKASNAEDWITFADLNTCDVYSGKSFPLGQILPEHPGFKQWRAMVGDRTWGITERGFHATPSDARECDLRAATIRREADWLATQPSCVLYIYWNTPGTEDNPELVLDDKGQGAVEYLTQVVTGGTPTPDEPPLHEVTCPTCKGKGVVLVEDDS